MRSDQMMEHSGGKEGERDCSRVPGSAEGSLLEGKSSTKPLAGTLASTISNGCKNVKESERTASGNLCSGPCSSGHDREVVFRGLCPADRLLAAHQPMYLVCCLDLRAGSRSVDHPVFALGVNRSLGGEN